MTVDYTDNITLDPQAAQDAVGRTVSAGLIFVRSRPEREIRVSPSLRAQRYAGVSGQNDDDYFLDVSAEQQLQHGALSLQGNYNRDTILTNDVDVSGLVEIGVRRESTSVKPGWRLVLTPESTMNLNVGYDKMAYAKDTIFGATQDYDYASGSVTYGRELEEGNQLTASLSLSRLETPEISSRAYHQGVQAGYIMSPSERFQLQAMLGFQHSRFARPATPGQEKSGGLIGFSLTGEREYGVLSVDLRRSVEPSGTGTLMQSDTATLSLVSDHRHALRSDLTVLWSDRSDLQGVGSSLDRSVAQVQISLRRRLSNYLTGSATYSFVQQRLQADDDRAKSNSMVFSLSYVNDPWIVHH